MDLGEVGWGDVYWIGVAFFGEQHGVQVSCELK
jgi:hypothetical protein